MKIKLAIEAETEGSCSCNSYPILKILVYPVKHKISYINGCILITSLENLAKQDKNWLYKMDSGLNYTKKNEKWHKQFHEEKQRLLDEKSNS